LSGALSLVLVLLAAAVGGGHPAPAPRPWIGVSDGHLVDEAGHRVRLLGVNRSGTEYRCQQGYGIFEGPTDREAIGAIVKWGANAVRVPLNETCWLGGDGLDERYSGAAYRRAIVAWVGRLEEAGLYVVLDLQFAAPGETAASEIVPMPDAEHAPAFWRSVAKTFRTDRGVLFDLYTEPHDIDWNCWEHGCDTTTEAGVSYRAAGMANLIHAVRSTGARQPVLLSGINWGHDLRGWQEHLPVDPRHAEVASIHTYDFGPCPGACRSDLAALARHHPVVSAELGEDDCTHTYIDGFMDWADRHSVSYLGWTWNAHHGWTCTNGPALIRNYDGAPTKYGVGLRDHLLALQRR
jgi:endoglucanase